jgi:hypothetical protein
VGERERIDATIVEAAIGDLRDPRFEHGHTPVERALGDAARALRIGAAACEQTHFVGIVAAALAGAVRQRAQQAAAHVRIERADADAENVRGLRRAERPHSITPVGAHEARPGYNYSLCVDSRNQD